MDVSGKVWGRTSKIFEANNVEVRRIVGVKGGRSSIHKHASKMSMIWVESGMISVTVEKNDYDLSDKTILTSGQSTIIKPHEFHYFEILDDGTICYEIYWVTLNDDDIIRKNCGSLGHNQLPDEIVTD